MQFEVPQFIEIEDKIFGPLTWKQFLYVGGGGMAALVAFFTAPFIVFLVVAVPIAILAALLAFYPINNRPFSYFLEAMYTFFTRKRLYHWRQTKDIVYKQSDITSLANPFTTDSVINKRDIASIARKLELDALQKK